MSITAARRIIELERIKTAGIASTLQNKIEKRTAIEEIMSADI